MLRFSLALTVLLAAAPSATAQSRSSEDVAPGSHYAALMETAGHALQSGLGSEAAALYEQAAGTQPQAIGAHVAAGWAHLASGDAEAAAPHFADARRLADARADVEHADALALDWGQAAVAFAQGRGAEGAVLFSRHDPGASCDAHGLAGATFPPLFETVMEGDSTLFRTLNRTAFGATVEQVRLHPDDAGWVDRLTPFGGSAAVFETEASLHPTSLPLRLAAARVSADPVAQVRAVLALDPANYEGLLSLSSALTWNGQLAEARDVLAALVAQHPDSARAHYALYTAQFELGDAAAARASLARADAIDPSFSARKRSVDAVWIEQLYCGAGLDRDAETGEWVGVEQALRCYEGMLMVYPENGVTWTHIGALRYTLGETAGAVEALRTASVLDPTRVSVWIALSDAYAELGQPEEAAEALARAARIAPDDPDVLYAQAAQWQETDRPAAIRNLRRVAAALPDDFDATFHLGRLLLLSEAADEAVPFLERARALDPSDPGTAFMLGAAYLTLDRMGGVYSELARLDALDPAAAAELRALADGSGDDGF